MFFRFNILFSNKWMWHRMFFLSSAEITHYCRLLSWISPAVRKMIDLSLCTSFVVFVVFRVFFVAKMMGGAGIEMHSRNFAISRPKKTRTTMSQYQNTLCQSPHSHKQQKWHHHTINTIIIVVRCINVWFLSSSLSFGVWWSVTLHLCHPNNPPLHHAHAPHQQRPG